MRDVKPNVSDAMSDAPGTDFSPADIDRLDAVRYLILASEREGARMMSAALRQVGLNSAQREVLEVVRQHGPLTLAELGRLLVCEVAAVGLLRERGSAQDIVVAATHGLLVHTAISRLHELELRRLLVTDTVAVKTAGTLIRVCSIAPTIADAISSLHADKPLHAPLARAR